MSKNINKKSFTNSEKFFAAYVADYKNQQEVQVNLDKYKLANVKIEHIAEGSYTKNGLNAVIYSKEVDGQKIYGAGVFGLGEFKDVFDVGRAIAKIVPKQKKDFINFVQDFRENHDITEPFDFVSGFSLGALVSATAAASHPNSFNKVILIDGPKVGKQINKILSNPEAQMNFINKVEVWNGLPNSINTYGKKLPGVTTKFIAPVKEPMKIIGSKVTREDFLRSPWQTHKSKIHCDGFNKNGLENIDQKYYESFFDSYTTKVDPNDFTKMFVIFNFDGKKYGEGTSGAKKLDNSYIYRATTPEEVALKFNVPLKNVIAGSSDYVDASTFFTIIPSNTEDSDSESDATKTGFFSSDNADSDQGNFFSNAWHSFKDGFKNFWGDKKEDTSTKPADTKPNENYSPIHDYVPIHLVQPLFEPFTPSINKYIYEPSWLYGNTKKNGDFLEDNMKFVRAKAELRSSISSCLSSSICLDTTSTLIDKAIASIYGSVVFATFSVRSLLKSELPGIIRSAITTTYIFDSTYDLGYWIHPLRAELGYAASHVSPLVLDLNGDGIKLLPYSKGVYFDIDNDGFKEKIGWVSPEDGQLARDLNGNGKIDDITELFGDDLFSAYLKLSLLDSNKDGVINEQDENFDELLIWQDKNTNGISEKGELQTLQQAGISSISLNTTKDDRIIEGNTITETSQFIFTDGHSGEVADVHFHNDDMDTWYQGSDKTNVRTIKFNKELLKLEEILLTTLYEKINNPASIKTNNKDWVAFIIKDVTAHFITNYKQQGKKNLAVFVSKTSIKFAQKIEEYSKYCQNQSESIATQLQQDFDDKQKEITNQLLEEIQEKFKQEQENIQSRYLQQYNTESKTKTEQANAQLKQKLVGVTNAAQLNAIKQTVQSQLDESLKLLIEEYKKLQTQEIEEARQKYQQEFNERSSNLTSKLEETIISDLNEKMHSQNHECSSEINGLKKMSQIEISTNVLQRINESNEFKQEAEYLASNIYNFFIHRVMFAGDDLSVQLPSSFNKLKDSYAQFTVAHRNDILKNDHVAITGIEIDPATLFLPLMRGYGNIPSLHIAMTKNPVLKNKILEFIGLKPSEFNKLQEKIMSILYEWAGVSAIDEYSRATAGGNNIAARKVAFVEQITGQEFKQLGAAKFVGQHASTAVQKAWDIALIRTTKNLLVQGPLMSIFPKSEYSFADDTITLHSSFDEILERANDFAQNNKLGYDFWVQLGYILALSAPELGISIDEIRNKLSELAGEPIMISLGTFELIGDDGDNIIKGTAGSDYIKGLKGNDKLYGEGGSDYLEGDEGDDELYGGEGIDRIYGGLGNDKIYGGLARDFLYGGDGDDEIYGEEGDDHIEGGPGADKMDGGPGNNTLSYGDSPAGVIVNLATGQANGGDAEGDIFKNFQNLGGSEYDDLLIGDAQDNYINGEGGNDEIYGGKGNDNLFGATGNDKLFGEEGDDILTGFEGNDEMDGGEGSDTVNYHHPYATMGVQVNLKTGYGIGGHAHGDTYVNIENVIGSKFNDIIQGDDQDNVLEGKEGDDIIYGEGGNDIIIGGPGDDRLFGENGNDTIILGLGGSNFAHGGNGTDTLSYQFSPFAVQINMSSGTATINLINEDKFEKFENIIGSEFDDIIIGDDQDNNIHGLKGNDEIYGGKGDDTILPGPGDDKVFGGEGNDYIFGDEGKDTIDGGPGVDTVDYSKNAEGIIINLERKICKGGFAEGDILKNIENIIGTNFDDQITGDSNNNILNGLDGNDIIHGGDGDDILIGGNGKNQLYGEGGNDKFELSKGQNTVFGGSGSNWVFYEKSLGNVTIDLTTKQGIKFTGEIDIFEDIANVYGSKYNDIIIGDDNKNYLLGGDGDDYIDGGDDGDTISGGKGNNVLLGAKGMIYF